MRPPKSISYDASYDIDYDESVTKLSKGDNVKAKVSGWTRFREGQVTRVNRDGTCDIYFEYGDECGERKSGVRADQIKSGGGGGGDKASDVIPNLVVTGANAMKNSEAVVMAAVTEYGRALQYASEMMKNNETVVLAAVTQEGRALEYASNEMKNIQAVVLAAVSQDGKALEFAGDEMKNNEAVVVAAVTQTWKALEYAGEEMKNNEVVVLVKESSGALAATVESNKDVSESKSEANADETEQVKRFETKSEDPISEEEIAKAEVCLFKTNEQVCRASPGKIVLRVAADVGIELASTCAHDLQSSSGLQFIFNSADITGLKPRVKKLDILAKAEGMALGQLALASNTSERGESGDGIECKGDDDDDDAAHASTSTTTYSTRLRLLNQAASKLRIAACGVFPDQEVASELAMVRIEQVKLETVSVVLRADADMAFEELRAFPHDDDDGEKFDTVQLAVNLADALLENTNLKPKDGAEVLFHGLVNKRVGSAVAAVEEMDEGTRTDLGDRIVRWGIDHPHWGMDAAEKQKNIKAFSAFLNGSLAMLVVNGPENAMWCGDEGKERLVKTRERVRREVIIQTLREFAAAVGLTSGADGDVKEDVTLNEEGEITKIEWKQKALHGDLSKFNDLGGRIPRLEVLDFGGNSYLNGDVAKLRFPVGMKIMNFRNCCGLTGAVDKVVLPVGMQSVNFYGCKGLTGDVGKLLLPEGMQTVRFGRCNGSNGSNGISGDITQLNLPAGMKTLELTDCQGLTGVVDKLVLPEGMQTVNFTHSVFTGDLTQWHLPVGMKDLKLRETKVTGKATSE
jgi:hypothetical protein